MITPIRRASVADLPAMESAAREFYASSKFLEDFRTNRFCSLWEELLRSGAGVIFMTGGLGTVTGVMGGLVHRDLYGESLIAEEMFWFVKREHRGVGVLLYKAFEQWAREVGAESIQMVHLLDSMPEKVSAFYLRRGFCPIETRYSKKLV